MKANPLGHPPSPMLAKSHAVGGSSSGRTTDSDSVYLGSNPSPPTNPLKSLHIVPEAGRPVKRAISGAPPLCHITRRAGGLYYFRRRLPRPHHGELALSLRTRHYRRAEALGEVLSAAWDDSLSRLSAEGRMKGMASAPVLRLSTVTGSSSVAK